LGCNALQDNRHCDYRHHAEPIARRGRGLASVYADNDLDGPLANLHTAPDDTVTIVAAGVCWYAGRGTYPWLTTNNARWHMIGVECACPKIRSGGSFDEHEHRPHAQISRCATSPRR